MPRPSLSALGLSRAGTLEAHMQAGGPAPLTGALPRAPYGGLALRLSLTPRPVWPPGEEVRTGHPTACPQPLGGQGSTGGTWPALCPPQMGGFTCLAFTEGRSHNQGLCPLRTDDNTRNIAQVCAHEKQLPLWQSGQGGRRAGYAVGAGPLGGGGQRQGQRGTETGTETARQGQRQAETGTERDRDRDRDRDSDRARQG